jgi:hypothetical protein
LAVRVSVTSSSRAINTCHDPRTLAGRTPSSQGAKNGLGWGWPALLPLFLSEELGPKARLTWKRAGVEWRHRGLQSPGRGLWFPDQSRKALSRQSPHCSGAEREGLACVLPPGGTPARCLCPNPSLLFSSDLSEVPQAAVGWGLEEESCLSALPGEAWRGKGDSREISRPLAGAGLPKALPLRCQLKVQILSIFSTL